MRAFDLYESAATELARKLPSLDKHDYNTIDKLMRKIAKKHHLQFFILLYGQIFYIRNQTLQKNCIMVSVILKDMI